MNDERRNNSIEVVLVSLGKLEQSTTDIKETVSTVKDSVKFQNGRVAKLERWQAFIQGAVAILILMIVPIVINFISGWLNFTFGK